MNTEKLSVREAALRLGTTQKYVRDLLYENRFAGAEKMGRRWLIPASAVEARAASRKQGRQS